MSNLATELRDCLDLVKTPSAGLVELRIRELIVRAADELERLETVASQMLRAISGEATKRGHAEGQLVAVGFFGSTEILLDGWRERIDRLERENAHWKSNHDEMVARNQLLRQRTDLTADQYAERNGWRVKIDRLERENAELHRQLGENNVILTAAQLSWEISEHENAELRATLGRITASHKQRKDGEE